MYASIQLDDFTTTSRHSVDLVLKASALLKSVKEWFGKIGIYVFIHIAVFPSVLILAYLRYRLCKKFPSDIKITADNYTNTRKSYDSLVSVTALLQPIAMTEILDAPWVLRFILAQIQKVFATMQGSTDRIGAALKELDTLPNDTKPRLFQLRTEAELWADRPSAYNYLA